MKKNLLFPIFLVGIVGTVIITVLLTVDFDNPNQKKILENRKAILPIIDNKIDTTAETISQKSVTIHAWEGCVLNEDGLPCNEAAITLYTDNQGAETKYKVDEYGRFLVKSAHESIILSASAADAIKPVTKALNPESSQFVNFTLFMGKKFYGTIMADASEPIQNATVTLLGYKPSEDQKSIHGSSKNANLHYEAKSQSDGTFSFSGLWPGEYLCRADAQGYLSHQIDSITPQNQLIYIILRKTSQLDVHVSDSQGKPVFLAGVTIQRVTSEGFKIVRKETATDATSRFFDLLPGRYRVEAVHEKYISTEKSKKEINIENDYEICDLVLNPKGYSISGIVKEPVQNQRIAGFPVSIKNVEFSYEGSAILQSVTSDESGNFAFHNIPAGNYLLTDNPGNNTTGYSAYGTPENKYRPKINITDHDITGVEFLVTHKALVSGTVYRDNQIPVAGAKVCCNGSVNNAFSITDEQGHYNFDSLPLPAPEDTGSAYLVAHSQQYGYGKSQEFEYKANDRLTIDIHLSPGKTLEGIVKDELNNPIGNAVLDIYDFQSTGEVFLTHSQENGSYRINNIPDFPLKIRVSANGYENLDEEIQFDPVNSVTKKDFVLKKKEKSIDITGYVLDKNDIPMENVLISWSEKGSQTTYTLPYDTEKDGFFKIENCNPGLPHDISAKYQSSPFYSSVVRNIIPTAEPVIIRMEFEPVHVNLTVTDPDNQKDKKSNYQIKVYMNQKDQIYNFPLGREEIFLREPGVYSIQALTANQYASKNVTIDSSTPKNLNINLSLETRPWAMLYFFCTNKNGEKIKSGYYSIIRLLEPPNSFVEYIQLNPHDTPDFLGAISCNIYMPGRYEVKIINFKNEIVKRFFLDIDPSKLKTKGTSIPLGDIPIE